MTFHETSPEQLKSLFAEAETNQAFLASKKEAKKTIRDVTQKMIDEFEAEVFELQNPEGKAVGFAVVFVKDSSLIIGPIYIASAYQGQGYSKVLLKHIVRLAKNKHLDSIVTKTWGENKASRHLFQSHDFTQLKEVLDYRVNGDSTVSYMLQLPSD